MAVLDRSSNLFETSDYQYGFKKHLGCRDAISTVRQVTESYISNGSTVNMCTLDLSKVNVVNSRLTPSNTAVNKLDSV